MTEAEQVACDALRSAGLDELADNLAFAREAVKVRATIIKAVTFIGESYDACISCSADGYNPHDRDCSMLPLLSTQPEFWTNQIELAHHHALRTDRLRSGPPSLASQRDVLDLCRREYLGRFPGALSLGDPLDLNATSEYAPPQAPTK